MDYALLPTEQVNARTAQLDEMSASEIARLMNELDVGAQQAVAAAIDDISAAMQLAADKLAAGGRIIYMGAGTSGRLGVLDASECPPTFGAAPEQVVGIIAGGDRALRNAVEGAEDDAELGAQDILSAGVNADDVVFGISASGTARYLCGALEAARRAGAATVSLTCNPDAPIHRLADVNISMPTGAEVLSGSTRLRAGTATKMALNMISTGAMVLNGKAYKNLMVDVRATNLKLQDRAVRIVMRALEIPRDEAEAAIRAADGELKLAIVMRATGADKAAAKAALEAEKGFTRRAIQRICG